MKKLETVQHHIVQYQESDFKGQFRQATLFSLFADLATQNAIEVGIWHDDLENHCGWVLSKRTMVFNRPIKAGEHIDLVTCVKGGSRVQFSRTYEIRQEEKILGGGFSLWTLIDLKSRKIVRPQDVGITIPKVEDYPCIVDRYHKIRKDIELEYIKTREVVYSDVDINQHMNNYRYVEWALDLIPFEIYRQYDIKEMSVHYIQEILPGSQVQLYLGKEHQDIKIVFKVADKTCFEMAVILQDRG
ncbi:MULTISPECIES: acyl-[acyl-carrier-protein] thioesterase [Coprobacillaceae]|uniref:acyl-[acyl-carrier-protein] thioesterase n=1 Tax=Coprobacillaceae TaxID=2810280 RepID=UPI000E4DA3B4|nr:MULTISPECIES: acyl-ACP thioesterase domain-containing protein [Coprobacillaceae]RHM59930.1 hypothetical protein DWZ53_08160 [Coprobacillus sp. AF33-1AC]RHS92267.1 hypothetical protein DW911_08585 [Erysipelatoclostridium sp. AM42-17]